MTESALESGPRYPIESVDSALRLLKLVTADRSVSVSAAARHLGVAPSTAHRLLAMLQHHGLVEQLPGSKAYGLGPWLTDVALTSVVEVDVRRIARPRIEQLVERVGETAHLVGLHGTEVVFIDCVECAKAIRATARIGQRMPAHCTAGGKAQLAALDPDRVLELYPDRELDGMTATSIRSRDELVRELARVRSAGYALNRDESESDLTAVAAAFRDARRAVAGAVTVAGPSGRMKRDRMRELADEVIAAAADIGAALQSSR